MMILYISETSMKDIHFTIDASDARASASVHTTTPFDKKHPVTCISRILSLERYSQNLPRWDSYLSLPLFYLYWTFPIHPTVRSLSYMNVPMKNLPENVPILGSHSSKGKNGIELTWSFKSLEQSKCEDVFSCPPHIYLSCL